MKSLKRLLLEQYWENSYEYDDNRASLITALLQASRTRSQHPNLFLTYLPVVQETLSFFQNNKKPIS